MKRIFITLSLILLIFTGSVISQSQFKTTIPDEIHLLQNPFMPMNILLIPEAIDGIVSQQGDLVLAFDGSTCAKHVIT